MDTRYLETFLMALDNGSIAEVSRSPPWWTEGWGCHSCQIGSRHGRRARRSSGGRCQTAAPLPGASASYGPGLRFAFVWCAHSWNRQPRPARRERHGESPIRSRECGDDLAKLLQVAPRLHLAQTASSPQCSLMHAISGLSAHAVGTTAPDHMRANCPNLKKTGRQALAPRIEHD
jgi:hypothetical protein